MDIKEFETSGQEISLQEVIGKLKFISRIKEGEKISVATMTIVKPDYYSRLVRSWSGESKEDTLKFVNDAMTKSIELARYYSNVNVKSDEREQKFNKDVAELIIKNIHLAKQGIKNLFVTYSTYAKFVTELETIIDTMDIKIQTRPSSSPPPEAK